MQARGELVGKHDNRKIDLDDQSRSTLSDYSITHFQSHRWQMLLTYPDDMLETFIAERTEGEEGELTSGELYMRAKT